MTSVTIDATAAASVHASAVNTISLTNLTIGTGNALLVIAHFGYSGHTGYSATWDAGGTNQGMGVPMLSVDNGAAAPEIVMHGLLNPTPGNKTLTITWSGAADTAVVYAISLNNVNTRYGLSGAFVAAATATSTSNAAALTMLPVQGGIQFVGATGLVSAGSPTGWAAGPTSLYVDSAVNTWGAGAYQAATSTNTFTQNINASEQWAIAGVVANPANLQFPALPLAINATNTISSGLAFAIPCLGAFTIKDLVTGHSAIPTGGCSTDNSQGFGGGLKFPSATTDIADFGNWQPLGNGDHTILALCNPQTSGGTNVICGQCDSGAAGLIILEANADFTSASNAGFMSYDALDSGGVHHGADDQGGAAAGGTQTIHFIDGGYHTFAGRNSGGTPTIWSDGTNTTRHTGAVSGTLTNVNQHFAVGNLAQLASTSLVANCTVVLALGWTRALTDAEMATITANPFQVLQTAPPPSPSAPGKVRETVIWWKP